MTAQRRSGFVPLRDATRVAPHKYVSTRCANYDFTVTWRAEQFAQSRETPPPVAA